MSDIRKALEEIAAKKGLCIYGYAGICELDRAPFQTGSNMAFDECAEIALAALAAVGAPPTQGETE